MRCRYIPRGRFNVIAASFLEHRLGFRDMRLCENIIIIIILILIIIIIICLLLRRFM